MALPSVVHSAPVFKNAEKKYTDKTCKRTATEPHPKYPLPEEWLRVMTASTDRRAPMGKKIPHSKSIRSKLSPPCNKMGLRLCNDTRKTNSKTDTKRVLAPIANSNAMTTFTANSTWTQKSPSNSQYKENRYSEAAAFE